MNKESPHTTVVWTALLVLFLVGCGAPDSPLGVSKSSLTSFLEDFESDWTGHWQVSGAGSVSTLPRPDGTTALLLEDDAVGPGPVYISRAVDLYHARSATLRLSLLVRSFTSDYSHGPHIWLLDVGPNQPASVIWEPFRPYVSFETNQFHAPNVNRGFDRCVSGGSMIDTGLKLETGTWYDLEIVADLQTGSTRLAAKRSIDASFVSYGEYPKDQCSTGRFNRVAIGTGLSWSTGAATELDNISLELEIDPLTVAFDVKPGSVDSPINPKSQGVTPAAVYGGPGFDVSAIDLATVTVNGIAVRRATFADVDGDAYPDLELKVSTPELAQTLSQSNASVELRATLENGLPIVGRDTVRLLLK